MSSPNPPPQQPGPQPPEQVQPPKPPKPHREGWRTPSGISAIAAAVTCVFGLISFLVVQLVDDRDMPAAAPPSVSVAAATNLIFVYGSSMPGQSRYPYIQHYVESSRSSAVTGYLYDSGQDYPIAKFGPGDPIPGFVLTLRPESAEEFFTEMTQIEAGLFQPVAVTATDGTRVRAYEWIGPTDGLTRISRWEGR
ncbi:MAG TPA: gamma-glutamylcyclotransferase [Propionibacteriaceae bacterium]